MRLCNNWNWSLLLRVNWDFKPYTLSRSLKQHPCMLFFVQVTESELGPSFVAVKIIVFLVRTWLSTSRVNIRCATDGKPRLPVRVDWSIPTCSAEKGCAIEPSNALAFSAYVYALYTTSNRGYTQRRRFERNILRLNIALPSLLLPFPPLEVGPLNPATGSGGAQ